MNRDDIIQYFKEFQTNPLPECIHRPMLWSKERLQIIIGPRKVGKTYVCYQKMHELMNQGVKKTQFLKLNFESPALNDIKYNEISKLIEIYWSQFPEKHDLYLFIDEPQVIDKWENAIYGLMEQYSFSIIITGSSSRLLSKDIASTLRGLGSTHTVYNLSFVEFCQFKNFQLNSGFTLKEKSQLFQYLDEYLTYGGYPKVVLEPNSIEKFRILNEYLQMIIYRDLQQRFRLNKQHQHTIKWLIKIIMQGISNELSINKLYYDLKSQQKSISNRTLYNLINILEDACLIYPLFRFDPSFRKETLTIPKIYVHDLGLATLFSQKDKGKRLENVVYFELLRQFRKRPLQKINYWRSTNNKMEIDFIIRDGEEIVQLIQVCYVLSDVETKSREISSLLYGLNEFNLSKGLIITYNEEYSEIRENKEIQVIPFWKWILNEDSMKSI